MRSYCHLNVKQNPHSANCGVLFGRQEDLIRVKLILNCTRVHAITYTYPARAHGIIVNYPDGFDVSHNTKINIANIGTAGYCSKFGGGGGAD